MKEHPTETRSREDDLKKLADAFFEHLALVSFRHGKDTWGIDPIYPLGVKGSDLAENILEIIGYTDDEECEHCGNVKEAPEVDDTAREYAMDLWDGLGLFLEQRWHDLNDLEAEKDNEQDEEECEGCEMPVSECTCENCDECGYTHDDCECCEDCGYHPCECDDGEEEDEEDLN